jgi:hypothetical protein
MFVEHRHGRCSPAATELSLRACSGHFDEFSLAASSPPHGSEMCPSYMANTESSGAKARSRARRRAGPAAQPEEEGHAAAEQDAAVVVAAVLGLAQGQRVRVLQLRAHRRHRRLQQDALARRLREVSVRNFAASRFVLSSFSFPCAVLPRCAVACTGKLGAISSSVHVCVCQEQISDARVSTARV